MIRTASIVLIYLSFLYSPVAMSLQDQGLSSIMDIIDRAVDEFNTKSAAATGSDEEKQKVTKAASSTVVNLSRTLGKLSYSRLQCGQADVLAEFTLRVQKMPEDFRDPMRDAFQAGFDQSKADAPLLSEDECKRLTESRTRSDKEEDEKTDPEKAAEEGQEQVEKEPEPVEDPRLKHFRIAELTGQLAYRRKFCGDKKIHSRDFNEVINNMPEEYREEAKTHYWKGYKHGKHLNKGISQADCY